MFTNINMFHYITFLTCFYIYFIFFNCLFYKLASTSGLLNDPYTTWLFVYQQNIKCHSFITMLKYFVESLKFYLYMSQKSVTNFDNLRSYINCTCIFCSSSDTLTVQNGRDPKHMLKGNLLEKLTKLNEY